MKFILQDEEIKLTNQLLGGFNLFLVTKEDDNLSYILTFPGLLDVSVRFMNLPKWLKYDDLTKELSGTPTGNDAGKLLLNFTVTHQDGVLEEQMEIVVNSSIVMGEGKKTKFTLPIFDQLRNHKDLSDNLVEDSCYGNPGVQLNLTDLENSEFFDTNIKELSNNWFFSDTDWKTRAGDTLYYEAVMYGKKVPKSGNWVTFDKGVFTFEPLQENFGIHPITINAYDVDGYEKVKTKTISVNVQDVNVTNRNDIKDVAINEGKSGSFMLPEFAELSPHMDLSDNVIHSHLHLPGFHGDAWGLDLSLNDLSNNGLWDLSNNDLSGNWTFFDSDFGTNKGDKLYYTATINGVTIPEKNNWITFSKGKISYSPLHQHVGVHVINISATDLSGNVSDFSFKLTVNDLHKRNMLVDREMFTGEVLEIELPEFKAMKRDNDLSDNIFTQMEGDKTFFGLDLSLNDLSDNQLWDLSNNDLSGNMWNFFDPDFGTNRGDKVLYKAYINGKLMEDHLHRDEGHFSTFNNGVLKFEPMHNDNGLYKIKVVTTDLSGNETVQEFNLLVKSKYIRNDIPDMNVDESKELVYELPEFKALLEKFDLSDNVINENGKWGIDLSLNDLSNNNLWDLSANDLLDNDLSNNDLSWNFFDTDLGTHKGDISMYEVRMDGELMPSKNNWATFNKGTFTFKPIGKNIGDHIVTVSTTDLSGNVAEQEFKLTVNAVFTPYIRSKFFGNKIGLKMSHHMKDNELLTFTLPEFESMNCHRFKDSLVKDFHNNDGIRLDQSVFSHFDTPSNLTDNWVFFDPTWLTPEGDDLFYTAKMNGVTIPREDNWITFKNGTFRMKPTNSNAGHHHITLFAYDLFSHYCSVMIHLDVKDTLAPVITLNGDLSMTHEGGTEYIDAGGIAFDAVDGRVPLVMTQTVDVYKLGMQVVKYVAKDSDGNVATAERHIEVVDTTAPVITLLGEESVTVDHGDEYVDAGATAHDILEGEIVVMVDNQVDTSKVSVYTVTYTAVDSSGNVATAERTVTVVGDEMSDNEDSDKNNLPVLGDIQVLLHTNELFEAVIPVTDVDGDEVTLTVENLPLWLSFDPLTNVLFGTPSDEDEGTFTITVHAHDGSGNVVSRDYNLIVVRICEQGTMSFEKGVSQDISDYGNETDFVKSVSLKFVEMDAKCVGLVHVAYETGNGGHIVDFEFSEEHQDCLVEMEVVTTFKPMFFKYRGNRMLQLAQMSDMSTFEPNRWAVESMSDEDDESVETYKTVFQGYFRDLHMNAGCVTEDFDAGICEDPHILTFGGNRLDLPHNDHIYSMINGLGLKINVKSQLIGEGSYAKYFYVNYKGEEFILDIEDLNIKQSANRVKTKYHMLESIDYTGNNFVFEKQLRSLIVRSTDGVMELVFNAETRGLLIKSRLNFTQENSTGVMMSNYSDECELKELTQ